MQHIDHPHRPSSRLSVPILACTAALVTALIMWLSDATAQQVDCSALSAFLEKRRQQEVVRQMLSEGAARPAPMDRPTEAAVEPAPGMQPTAAAALGGLALDAMHRVGWRSGVKFAAFDASATIDAVLSQSLRYSGAFLLILPGNGTLTRRSKTTPFFTIDKTAIKLRPVLYPAVAALNAAAGVLETSIGRRLFPFRLEAAPLPACTTGSGPCAVWEASSGRLVLDAALANKMVVGVAGEATSAEAAASGSATEAKSDGDLGAVGEAPPESDEEVTLQAAGVALTIGNQGVGGGSLSALLASFVEMLAEQAADAGVLLKQGKACLLALAAVFAKAGATSVTLLMASQVPLWWCIACPLVLGMLAPFIFNFGLTAAAEALCAQLQLPDQTCNDLWWGAFAVALMMSLASAIPIVYLCRLPECGRRGVAVAGGALTVAARRVAS